MPVASVAASLPVFTHLTYWLGLRAALGGRRARSTPTNMHACLPPSCTYGYVHACTLWVLHGYGMPIYDRSLYSITKCNALVCSAAHKSSVLDLVKYPDQT